MQTEVQADRSEALSVDSSRVDFGTSVGKAIALLEAFDRPGGIGVSELSRSAGLPKSTAYRLLQILEEWQFIERAGRRYRLGSRLFELGNRVPYCTPRSLRDIAHPFLEELYELSHETVHLAVLNGTDVLYLEKLYGHNPVRSPSYIGGRVPAYSTALGKAMLAFSNADLVTQVVSGELLPRTPHTLVLPRLFLEQLRLIKAAGVAFDREEASIGLTCVAAPILDKLNQPVAAISISGATCRFRPDEYAAAVRRAALAIRGRLGHSGAPYAGGGKEPVG
jgi:IclR family transcriptional regulator, KDG regulon repressor